MTDQQIMDAVHPQETDDDFVTLLLIEHPDMVDIRLATAPETLVGDDFDYTFAALGEVWTTANFSVTLPRQTDEPTPIRITVPNVDTRIGEALDSITTPATCTVWAVLASDPDVITSGPHQYLELRRVRGDAEVFEGELSRVDVSMEPWPYETISPSIFLAAARVLNQ